MNDQQTVVIVDDDSGVRDSLSMLLESVALPHRLYASAAAGPQLDGAFDEHPAASTLDLAAFQAYGRLVDPQNLGRRIDAIRVDGHLWQCLEPVEHIEEDKDPDTQTFILDPKQRARLGLVPAGGG